MKAKHRWVDHDATPSTLVIWPMSGDHLVQIDLKRALFSLLDDSTIAHLVVRFLHTHIAFAKIELLCLDRSDLLLVAQVLEESAAPVDLFHVGSQLLHGVKLFVWLAVHADRLDLVLTKLVFAAEEVFVLPPGCLLIGTDG